MKKNFIYTVLATLIFLVIVILVIRYNPFKGSNLAIDKQELNRDSIQVVEKDSEKFQITYEEFKQYKLNAEKVFAIDVVNYEIFIAYDKVLKVLNQKGEAQRTIDTEGDVKSIKASNDGSVFILHTNFYVKLDKEGSPLYKSDEANEKAVFTSIAIMGNEVFVADAGNRVVRRYNSDGEMLGEFEGVFKSDNDSKGFIIPSPYFDLAVNNDNELWVVNPGLHTFQHYSPEGDLINFWESTGNHIEGFAGCCNPAQMCITDDGRFVTAEKGNVRIKIYSKDGQLEDVVALPESFKGNKAPDLAIGGDLIYALDYDQKMVRVFKKKEDE